MNRTQVLKRIRFHQFTTDTFVEDIYTNKKFRLDDVIVSPQDDLYSLDRKGKPNHSLLDHHKRYRDLVTIENTSSQDSSAQKGVGENFPWRNNKTSDSIADTVNSDTHSSQNYVIALKFDARSTNDVSIENDDMSNLRQDWFLRHYTDLTATKEEYIPASQTDELIQAETFSHDGKCNLLLNLNPNFSDSNRY